MNHGGEGAGEEAVKRSQDFYLMCMTRAALDFWAERQAAVLGGRAFIKN